MRVGLNRAPHRRSSTDRTDETSDGVVGQPDGSAVPVTVGRQRPLWLQAGAPSWIWLGVIVTACGFVLIAIAWGQVAGETQVHLQLPYVVSAGFVGLGLIMVGLAVLNVASRQRDAIDRDRQIDQLIDIMGELHRTLAGKEGTRT